MIIWRKDKSMSNQQSRPWAAKWGILISFAAVFALVFGLYLPGCSDNPTSSTDTLSQDETGFFDEPFDDIQYARLVELAAATDDEYLYGEEFLTVLDGGSIVIGTNGNFHEFLVPAGALPYNATISLEILKVEKNKDDKIVVIYDFAPDGLVFNQSAYLIIDPAKLLGKKATCVDFYYLDESANPSVWKFQGTYCVEGTGSLVTIPVDHFSKYGIE